MLYRLLDSLDSCWGAGRVLNWLVILCWNQVDRLVIRFIALDRSASRARAGALVVAALDLFQCVDVVRGAHLTVKARVAQSIAHREEQHAVPRCRALLSKYSGSLLARNVQQPRNQMFCFHSSAIPRLLGVNYSARPHSRGRRATSSQTINSVGVAVLARTPSIPPSVQPLGLCDVSLSILWVSATLALATLGCTNSRAAGGCLSRPGDGDVCRKAIPRLRLSRETRPTRDAQEE